MISHLANIVGNLTCGENCRIDPFVTITGNVTLGNNVHIGVGVCIFGKGGVFVGDMTSLSAGCKIFTSTEDPDSGHLSNPTVPNNRAKTLPVHIGKRSIIGANSVVLPGAVIPDDTQVGALSLVNKEIEGNSIHAGIPVRRLRDKPEIIQ